MHVTAFHHALRVAGRTPKNDAEITKMTIRQNRTHNRRRDQRFDDSIVDDDAAW